MLKASILIFSLSIIAGCSSSSDLKNSLVYIERLDTNATNEYDLITCKYNSSKIRIVAKRLKYSDCKMVIKGRTFYKLDLIKIDTVVHATVNIQSYNGNVVVSFGSDDPYFRGDKLVGELYSSPDLDGICITNPNVFHYP